MTDRRIGRYELHLDPDEQARIRVAAEAVGAKIAPYIREKALNPAVETAAERRQAVAALFGLRRELAELVLAVRGVIGDDDYTELRGRVWGVTERIDRTIDAFAEQGIAS